jgi:hypothetical protein
MSTEWSKYATPEEVLARAKHPADNGVIELIVGDVRAIPGLTVEHAPLSEVRAHTDVLGEKNTERRFLLLRACRIVIPIRRGIDS